MCASQGLFDDAIDQLEAFHIGSGQLQGFGGLFLVVPDRGLPDAVVTDPRLPDGTPFPTTYYLTCPRAASLIGTLESSGLMREMETRLRDDADLAAAYRAAHEAYLVDRTTLGDVPEIAGVSAGGMPDRVKCLHVLAAHALAVGPGVNPLGDEVVDRLGEWWAEGPCVEVGVDG